MGDDKFTFTGEREKMYVLSMFPYPSGNLHMGHVRVYTISDAMARFYRMNNKEVLHPMGWDAFGLPAENAAIQRKIPAKMWTEKNIEHMRKQLNRLGSSFDWSRELSTCDPAYFRWTQVLFLKLNEAGLVYRKEALVNWDPIDRTVLADEQVDANGCSWRSGAKVEKKLLNQWFIRTTKFAQKLYDGLNDPILEDWKDIIKLQKHWIGECNGNSFNLAIDGTSIVITIWTEHPEDLTTAQFIVARTSHEILSKLDGPIFVVNPFVLSTKLRVIFSDAVNYPESCDLKLGAPHRDELDLELAKSHKITPNNVDPAVADANREMVLQRARELDIGGYPVSSKLKDWLISRQRYWGTPIPMIHCGTCGTMPVEDSDLPVQLPDPFDQHSGDVLTNDKTWLNVKCSKCGGPARRESDTMDTFVDSSWYFLRFLDTHNQRTMFDEALAAKVMPVDLYVGGKEHAVLHLYYARFINHFLHSIGLVPHPEPFKRLLVQGMVMGRSFRLKGSGQYLREDEVEVVDAKKNRAVQKATGDAVVMSWEKMSKSKMNGVDPEDMINTYGCDTTRLIMLADVAPTSHRNWSSATFPGILNWQNRLWLTIGEFNKLRSSRAQDGSGRPDTNEFREGNDKMWDARNYYAMGVTFNYKSSHQLSVAISKMQGLTNSIRRACKETITYSEQYERAIAAQIIMLAPMAPHFASELWAKFVAIPNRLNPDSAEIRWSRSVFEQKWPDVDMDYELKLIFRINGYDNALVKIPRKRLDIITQKECEELAYKTESVREYIDGKQIKSINLLVSPGYEAVLNIFLERFESQNKKKKKVNAPQ